MLAALDCGLAPLFLSVARAKLKAVVGTAWPVCQNLP
jgi:hypothetical protein